MRTRFAAILGAAATTLALACSSGGTTLPGSQPTLEDEYEPTADVPASGGISQIAFHADGSYVLKRVLAPTADEILSTETGTWSLDPNASTLTLTPAGGAAQVHPIQIGLTGAASAMSISPDGLHTMGFGDVLKLVISFFLDGQWFHTDTPATPTSGSDDAGWPEDSGATGCSQPLPQNTGSSGDGIDISHYQPGIDWTQVRTARNWAFAKATEGTGYKDPSFASNYAGIQAAGLKRGAYHFFRASKDAVKQADAFVAVLQANGFDASGDLAPMLDVEVTDGMSASTVVAGVKAFLAEAQSKLGVTMFIYTGPSFWTSTLGNPSLSQNPLWIAHYTSKSHPTVPSTWSTYTIWQYSSTETVPGYSGPVDGDRWNGALASSAADGGAGDSGPCPGLDGGDGGGILHGPDAGDAGLIPGTCTHDVCTAGTALGQACDSCTMIVCANDPYCCDTYWGISCFPDVQKYCGQTCP